MYVDENTALNHSVVIKDSSASGMHLAKMVVILETRNVFHVTKIYNLYFLRAYVKGSPSAITSHAGFYHICCSLKGQIIVEFN